jgi:hypothetical protein
MRSSIAAPLKRSQRVEYGGELSKIHKGQMCVTGAYGENAFHNETTSYIFFSDGQTMSVGAEIFSGGSLMHILHP